MCVFHIESEKERKKIIVFLYGDLTYNLEMCTDTDTQILSVRCFFFICFFYFFFSPRVYIVCRIILYVYTFKLQIFDLYAYYK